MANLRLVEHKIPIAAGEISAQIIDHGPSKPKVIQIKLSGAAGAFFLQLTEGEWEAVHKDLQEDLSMGENHGRSGKVTG